MPEERGRGLLLLMVFGIFLCWGIDESWRKEVIRLESLWLIRMLEQRAFDLGMATHEGLRQLLRGFYGTTPGILWGGPRVRYSHGHAAAGHPGALRSAGIDLYHGVFP